MISFVLVQSTNEFEDRKNYIRYRPRNKYHGVWNYKSGRKKNGICSNERITFKKV